MFIAVIWVDKLVTQNQMLSSTLLKCWRAAAALQHWKVIQANRETQSQANPRLFLISLSSSSWLVSACPSQPSRWTTCQIGVIAPNRENSSANWRGTTFDARRSWTDLVLALLFCVCLLFYLVSVYARVVYDLSRKRAADCTYPYCRVSG